MLLIIIIMNENSKHVFEEENQKNPSEVSSSKDDFDYSLYYVDTTHSNFFCIAEGLNDFHSLKYEKYGWISDTFDFGKPLCDCEKCPTCEKVMCKQSLSEYVFFVHTEDELCDCKCDCMCSVCEKPNPKDGCSLERLHSEMYEDECDMCLCECTCDWKSTIECRNCHCPLLNEKCPLRKRHRNYCGFNSTDKRCDGTCGGETSD